MTTPTKSEGYLFVIGIPVPPKRGVGNHKYTRTRVLTGFGALTPETYRAVCRVVRKGMA